MPRQPRPIDRRRAEEPAFHIAGHVQGKAVFHRGKGLFSHDTRAGAPERRIGEVDRRTGVDRRKGQIGSRTGNTNSMKIHSWSKLSDFDVANRPGTYEVLYAGHVRRFEVTKEGTGNNELKEFLRRKTGWELTYTDTRVAKRRGTGRPSRTTDNY